MIFPSQRQELEPELLSGFQSSLYHFPVSLFSAVMGTAGLSRAFRLAEGLFQFNRWWSLISGLTAWIIFAFLFTVFILKLYQFPYKVITEFLDPVKGRFYGTIPISILLLSAVTMPYTWLAGFCCWLFGTALICALAYLTIYNLFTLKHAETDFEPAMILPAVGILNVAQTGSFLQTVWVKEINTFCFAVGAVLTVVFLNLIISRLFRYQGLSMTMEPTLMILASPFGVAFLAYSAVSGSVDLFAAVLFYFGLFFFLVLIFSIFFHQRNFTYIWWSMGFPTAALTNASLKYALHNHEQLSAWLAALMLFFLSLLTLYLLIQSGRQLIKGIFLPK
jgi:tellurite resistance protein